MKTALAMGSLLAVSALAPAAHAGNSVIGISQQSSRGGALQFAENDPRVSNSVSPAGAGGFGSLQSGPLGVDFRSMNSFFGGPSANSITGDYNASVTLDDTVADAFSANAYAHSETRFDIEGEVLIELTGTATVQHAFASAATESAYIRITLARFGPDPFQLILGHDDNGTESFSFIETLGQGSYTLTVDVFASASGQGAAAGTTRASADLSAVFTPVPAPGAFGALAATGLLASRRRR